MLVLALGACASPIDYEPASVWNDDHGWRDEQVGPDEYSIVVQGNAHTTPDRTARIALLRAAHLTLEQGRSHFELLDDESVMRAQDVTATVPVMSGGATLFIPVDVRSISEPIVVLLIRLLPEGADSGDNRFDARTIVTSLESEFE